MTIAIGLHLGSCVLLASDTRTTFFEGSNLRTYYDDSEKIQKTRFGLITGAGNLSLLDSVKRRMLLNFIENTDDMLRIIHEERNHLKNKYKYSLEVFRNLIESTGWIFTYHTYIKEKPLLRLAVYHPTLDNGIGYYEKGNPAIIFPFEAKKEERDYIGSIFEDSFKHLNNFETIQETLQYYCELIFVTIRLFQPKYPSISKYVQYGVHTFENLVGISKIIKNENISFDLQLNPLI